MRNCIPHWMRPTPEEMIELAGQVALGLGVKELKSQQKEVLLHLASGRSAFAGLPTGYGKSLCYWLPAEAWGWRVWVVSPLVSLIEDQALACEKLGIPAIAWHGNSGPELEARMAEGRWRICLLSPERLASWARSGQMQRWNEIGLHPDLLVLDEMHCLDEWRLFRSAYRDLFEHVKRATSSGSLLLGLSASLALQEGKAWMEELAGDYRCVGGELGRENLVLQVLPLEEEEARWALLLSSLRGLVAPQSAIVYCASRNECDVLARWLRSTGTDAVAYHAGIPMLERSARSHAFRSGRLRVVCATSAFGMGIDYPHVSLVLHFSVPRDLESYWQEVGRAGRGGQEAYAVALWRRSEIFRARWMEPKARARYFGLWKAWLGGDCRKRVIADQLGLPGESCGRCDRCRGAGAGLLLERIPPAWWVEAEAEPFRWLEERLQSFEKP